MSNAAPALYSILWYPLPGRAWPAAKLEVRAFRGGRPVGCLSLSSRWGQTGDSLAIGKRVGLPGLGAVEVDGVSGDVDGAVLRLAASCVAAHLGAAVSHRPEAWRDARCAPGEEGELVTEGRAGFWCRGDGSPRGLFVAARPSIEHAHGLVEAHPGARAEDLHLTLAYFGRFAPLSAGAAAVARAVGDRPWWRAGRKVGVDVVGVDVARTPEGDAPMLLLDPAQPARWRDDLLRRLPVGAPAPRADHAFLPHVTLAHVPPMAAARPDAPQRVEFDSLWICVGRRAAGFPL